VLVCHGTPGSDLVTLLETGNCQASRTDIEERLGGVTAGLVAAYGRIGGTAWLSGMGACFGDGICIVTACR